MTELEELQHRRIAANGPLSVADYMAECLFHPRYGYYTTREPFGRGGDFITAPEISQMFGEIVGAWMVHAWHQAGCPSPFIFAEIGPGRGTLMRDTVQSVSSAGNSLNLQLRHSGAVPYESVKAFN